MVQSSIFGVNRDAGALLDEVQGLLRAGAPAEAEAKLTDAFAPLEAAGHPVALIAARTADAPITLHGWGQLAERIRSYGAREPITALGIDMSWPGHVGQTPDAKGVMEPYIETNYYADSPVAFSTLDRAGLLAIYEDRDWQGSFVEVDNTIETAGLNELYGPSYPLAPYSGGSDRGAQNPLDYDAGILGSALTAVRLHRAVLRAVREQGLPRPMTVLVGSNEAYPFFDAPVITADEY